jgi:hypothetical protein
MNLLIIHQSLNSLDEIKINVDACWELSNSSKLLLALHFLCMWSILASWLQHMPTLPRLLLKTSNIHIFLSIAPKIVKFVLMQSNCETCTYVIMKLWNLRLFWDAFGKRIQKSKTSVRGERVCSRNMSCTSCRHASLDLEFKAQSKMLMRHIIRLPRSFRSHQTLNLNWLTAF